MSHALRRVPDPPVLRVVSGSGERPPVDRPPRILPDRAREPLLSRARREPEAFAEFYVQHHDHVLGFFARKTPDPETAVDLMAETFAAAFAALPSFRGETAEEGLAWLWTIARHQLYRWSTRRAVERRSLAILGAGLAPVCPGGFDRVEELASLERVKDEVLRALGGLRTDQQMAVRMRIIDERPYATIARQLGISDEVARARVSRGLRELARVLEPRRAALQETVA
jgi:RNA polymerase sigma factor (sigma-70 family)